MKNATLKSWLALSASSLLIAGLPATAFAQDTEDTLINPTEDIVISTGTRRALRSAADTPAPVDVISNIEFTSNAADDVQDLLRTSVPSYNVNTQPISDAASIVRPANLRGLSPDNTLVLVNGKRRHRGAVIAFLGGGIADGSQGVDVSAIPSLALKQVEVLRDGASSQYGSDAIAGVINFVLKDDQEGGTFEAKYGSTYDGDGDNYRFGINGGTNIGDDGYLNATVEFGETDGTVRSVVRDDVLALIAAGNTDAADFRTINGYTDEVPQYWGQPDVRNELKGLVNLAIPVSDEAEFYGVGIYAERQTQGGFFYRNPTNRGGVYRGPQVDADGNPGADFASVRVGDLDGLGQGEDCPAGIPLSQGGGLIPDPDVLAQVQASANCFSFIETIPGGFVPRFGGELQDFSLSGGLRGEVELGTGLTYDLSVTHGESRVDYRIENTVNASLGPDTPRDFTPGGQRQSETVLNADFGYLADVAAASDMSIAFGFEYREEVFDLFAGDEASFALGPLADQGFSSSSNGFGGFPNSSTNRQDSYAGYLDLEVDLAENFTAQLAGRYEDFSEFGDTFDYKVAALYKVSDSVSLRATHSTGFHAPTAGQANITNVTTQNVNGVLIDQGTLPLNTAAGLLAADFIEATEGGRPELGPENAKNYSAGVALNLGAGTITIDAFSIDVKDRIALGANVDFLSALQNAGATATDVSSALTELDAAGVIDRNEFRGLDQLSQFRFFSNSFDTKTQGVDIVARYPFELAGGFSNVIVAGNYTDTEVTDRGDLNPISDGRVAALEDLLPNVKGSATFTHDTGVIRGMLRANYYGKWDDTGNGVNDVSQEILVDAEVAAEVAEGVEIAVGAANLFDNYPDRNPGAGGLGQLYPEASPTGFNGGQYYARFRYNW
jgi:iron complex outermembrane receptor protein